MDKLTGYTRDIDTNIAIAAQHLGSLMATAEDHGDETADTLRPKVDRLEALLEEARQLSTELHKAAQEAVSA